VKNKYANDIIIGATTGSWAFGELEYKLPV